MKHFSMYPNVKLKDEGLSKNAQLAYCICKSIVPEIDSFRDYEENLRNELFNLRNDGKWVRSVLDFYEKQKAEQDDKLKKTDKKIDRLKTYISAEESKPWSFILVNWFWHLLYGRAWERKLLSLEEELSNEKRIQKKTSQQLVYLQGKIDTVSKLENNYDGMKKIEGIYQEQTGIEKKSIEAINSLIEKVETEIEQEEEKPWDFFLIKWLWPLLFKKGWMERIATLSDYIDNYKSEKSTHDSLIKQVKKQIEEHLKTLNKRSEDISELDERIAELPVVPKILNGIGESHIPIFPIKIKERGFVQDGKELNQEVFTFVDFFSSIKEFNIPQLEVDLDQVLAELDFIESYRTDDVLIKPTDSEKDDLGIVGELIGKEKELHGSLIRLQKMLEKVEAVKVKLPIVDNNDKIKPFLQESLDMIETGKYSTVKGGIDDELVKQYEDIHSSQELVYKFLSEEFQNIINIDNKISIIKEEISVNHDKTKKLRIESSRFLSEYLQEMSHYSDMVSNHYFCPKCNVTDRYLLEVTGIDFNYISDFSSLPTSRLKELCFSFLEKVIFIDKMGSKMSKNEREAIVRSWELAFDNLSVLENEIDNLDGEKNNSDSNIFRLSLMREIKTKQNLYRHIVRSLLKNHRTEWRQDNYQSSEGEEMSLDMFKNIGEEMNQNTKLVYEISSNNWLCPLCGTEYDSEEAKMGASHKIIYELELPVLKTLWNDENVVTKVFNLHKDISREHRDRMVQVAESIQSRIDQFLADDRQIRQTIQQKYSQSYAAMKNVKNIGSKFGQFDLLDNQTEKELISIADQSEDRLEKVKALMDKMKLKENELSELPKQIAFETKVAIEDHLSKNIKLIKSDSR